MVTPVIPWIGGKRRLAKHIIPLFPEHKCYVEPFCGAAAIFFMKEPSKVEVINDLNNELIHLYRVIQSHPEEFCRQFKWALSSRTIYRWLQDIPVETLTDIQRAARFYYLQKLAFGGHVSGQTFGTATTTPPRLNLFRIEEELSSAHLRLASTYIEHLSWQDCIAKYDRPHSLFYLDPPYWQTAGYGTPFELDQYQQLAEIMQSLQGKAILSINDHPEMRETFAAFKSQTIDINYTLAKGAPSKRRELIITTWQ